MVELYDGAKEKSKLLGAYCDVEVIFICRKKKSLSTAYKNILLVSTSNIFSTGIRSVKIHVTEFGNKINFVLQIPPTTITTSDTLILIFKSDSTVTWKGFAAEYQEIVI